MKYASGKLLTTSPLHTLATFPAAADYPGAMAQGTDGQVYTSVRYPDETEPYGWWSVSQISEDIAFDVIRTLDEDIAITVGTTGADYTTLGAAFRYLAKFVPTPVVDDGAGSFVPHQKATIIINSGFVVEEQVNIDGTNFGWVGLESVDASVLVMEEALTRSQSLYSTNEAFPCITVRHNGVAPRIRTMFESVPETVPRATNFLTLWGGTQYVDDLGLDLYTAGKAHGIKGFHTGILIHSGSQASLIRKRITDARSIGVRLDARSGLGAFLCVVRGATNSVQVNFQSNLHNQFSDLRRTAGVDSASDVLLTSGSLHRKAAATAPLGSSNPEGTGFTYGGYNIAAHTVTESGVVYDAALTTTAAQAPYGLVLPGATVTLGIRTVTPLAALDARGRALIGATGTPTDESSGYQLQVQATSGNAVAKLAAGAGSSSFLAMGTTADALTSGLSVANTTGTLSVRAGNANRVTVLSGGNVGIGEASPSVALHVNGPVRTASYTVGTVPSASTSGAGSQIYVSNETGGAVTAFSDGTNWRRVTDRAIIS